MNNEIRINFERAFLSGQLYQPPTMNSDDKFNKWFNLIIKMDIIEFIFNSFKNSNEIKWDYIDLLDAKIDIGIDPTKDFFLLVQSLIYHYSLECNYLNPFCSEIIKLNNQSYRVSLIHPSINFKKGFKLFIRKMGNKSLPLYNFTKNECYIKKLDELISNRENILITGNSGSGKTTLLKSLITKLPESEHCVILEDLPELSNSMNYSNNVSHFITRPSFKQNSNQIEMNELCSYVMRINPDRLILGEIRSEEIGSLLLCMNCGVRGVMTTLHAIHAHEAFNRLGLLYAIYQKKQSIEFNIILNLIASHFKYVIHLENKEITQFIKIYNVSGTSITYDEITSL